MAGSVGMEVLEGFSASNLLGVVREVFLALEVREDFGLVFLVLALIQGLLD